MINGHVDKIILSRPAVEAGERLGFLPGDMKEKVDPYMQPLYDALHDFLPGKTLAKLIEEKTIEIAPLAFMRGRTLSNAYVVLDEAQNATSMQMKMFLTRLGQGSRMVITGDRSQVDLPRGQPSGLIEAERILDGDRRDQLQLLHVQGRRASSDGRQGDRGLRRGRRKALKRALAPLTKARPRAKSRRPWMIDVLIESRKWSGLTLSDLAGDAWSLRRWMTWGWSRAVRRVDPRL
jgi:hypothetical protein